MSRPVRHVQAVFPLITLTVLGCGGSGPDASSPAAQPVTATASMSVGDPGKHGENILKNGEFAEGTALPWTTNFDSPAAGKAELDNEELCFAVTAAGRNTYDVLLRQRPVTIKRHRAYTIKFKAHSTAPTRVRPNVAFVSPMLEEVWSSVVSVGPKPEIYSAPFKYTERVISDAELVLHFGGPLAAATPFTVCVDDVSIEDPDYIPPDAQAGPPLPRIRVNQVGYLPRFDKRATLKDARPAPETWELLDASGKSVASGKTRVFGEDRDAGEFVHIIDFSSHRQPGTGYTLKAGDATSPPFAIEDSIYSELKKDALRFFYHQRSGIAIQMPYAGQEQWVHPAGHLSDKSVRCGEGTGCSYSLDVSGGWYDAGDHGKYVVNAGFAVWTLLDLYERKLLIARLPADVADSTLDIPESGNGTSDLLDEVRWEVEWMMKMQVPEGQKLAGMVHHKVHDVDWTAIPVAPHEDSMERALRPPSTAATLNLAAVGAQCARVWRTVDPAFAQKCLGSAERAYRAALAHPSMFARGDDIQGGGSYADSDVSDERYWAETELFITTGQPQYLEAARRSPHFLKVPHTAGGGNCSMSWNNTAALGTLSLAVVPSKLPRNDLALARRALLGAADEYVADSHKRGYRVPLESMAGRYPWGSNSLVLNNGMILGLAYDLSKKPSYLIGVVDVMDYLLGRNPLSKSYVSGYGTNPLVNPHHRFFARQLSDQYPPPPPGIVSGGPNSSLDDEAAKRAGLGGCAAQQCYYDNIQSYSTNEVAINWNAPLAWVAAYLDEKAKTPR
jgi:endoglucanase